MAKLLYVKVNPKEDENSDSSKLANHFLQEYEVHNPEDEIEILDLYKADIPFLDVDVFRAWGKFASKEKLTPVELEKSERMDQLTDQFMTADKVVFSAPFWNLSFPPMLKAYMDTICIVGKTFHYTAEGAMGLLEDRPCLLIETRGGFYSEGPNAELEFSKSYLQAIMSFLGIHNFQAVIAEGLDVNSSNPERTRADCLAELSELAKTF
ncbi:FMN-dependent NADH-azoreductase 4 [Bacillus sp. OxB-1]|uniref:FMN-dependent NADH-azoreductase n=1 Tax=Bacillus sp. (strain OxB-1) TaxID=98228 RepID=UPI000582297F|nr:NAD(P)H-dependent oxidoreductase [Bacillus sp. OxB-1]BAQ11697.1 FMN-dependent NADH-azoreductase 4 [Bacillus sp. OxB-1]